MPKNIVVLSDGTGQKGGKGVERNTNVYKLFTLLEDRTPRQVVFYDPGLGTGMRKITGNVAGAGISTNVLEAYRFIFDHHEVGDRIYLLGFSRGATTVRSLAGLIDHFGILPRSRPDLIRTAYNIYKTRPPMWAGRAKRQMKAILADAAGRDRADRDRGDAATVELADEVPDVASSRADWFRSRADRDRANHDARDRGRDLVDRLLEGHKPAEPIDPVTFMRAYRLASRARDFKAANYSYDTQIEFLGCFDTVAALYRIPKLQPNFHELRLTYGVKHAFHALALDEQRKAFLPVLFEEPFDHQTVRQVWFSGVHTDIGGGYPERGLADISLAWMLRKAHNHGLLLDPGEVRMAEDHRALLHDSRGKLLTRLVFRKKVRLGSHGDRDHPVIHESVLLRALERDLDTASPRDDVLGADPAEFWETYLNVRKSLRDGTTTRDQLDPEARRRYERVEEWEPYDVEELLSAQEDRWNNWIALTTKTAPRQFATERSRILTWFSGSLDGSQYGRTASVRVWDLETGDQVGGLTGHSGVVAVAVTGDGSRIVSASPDGTLKVWDVRSGDQICSLTGHTGIVAVAVTGDGSHIVSASTEGTLRVWDVAARSVLRTLDGHEGEVLGVAITPDSSTIASASTDGTLMVWDLPTGDLRATLESHHGDVLAIAITPDGSRVVSAATDGAVQVWDIRSFEVLETLDGPRGSVCGVAATPEAQHVVAASRDKSVRVWDTGSRTERTLEGHTAPVAAVAVTPTRIVSASDDTTVKVWDLETGRELRTFTGHTGPVAGVAITSDGSRVVSASLERSFLHRLADSTSSVVPRRSTKVARRRFRRRDAEGVKYDGHTALLVVDVQHDFADPTGTLSVPGGDKVIDVINAEIERARGAGAPVFYTLDWHNEDTPHFETGGGRWPRHCVMDTKGADLHPGLTKPKDDSFVVKKGSNDENGYSGFTMSHLRTKQEVETELRRKLEDLDITRVVIAGLALDYTVKYTALDAANKGFDAVVLLEATRPLNVEDGERAIREMADAGVDVRRGASAAR